METDPEGVRSTLLLQGALDDGRQVLRRRLTRVDRDIHDEKLLHDPS